MAWILGATAKKTRPLAGALGVVQLIWVDDRARSLGCEQKIFRPATCIKNEFHTHDTRKITFALNNPWTDSGAIGNVLVQVDAGSGKGGSTVPECCACCKCPGPCGCPAKDSAVSTKAVRPYNPISSNSGKEVTLVIKKYPDSKVGARLHDL